MTGAEHYEVAERFLDEADNVDAEAEPLFIARAQAHATLALAAATALPVVDRYKGDSALTNQWSDAIGWTP